jgi:hypothetical protein
MTEHHPIVRAAAKLAKCSPDEIIESRKREQTAWRQVAIAVMRDSGLTYGQIAGITNRDASTVCACCLKLDKLKGKPWFVKMRKQLMDDASADKSKRLKREALDQFCANIPPQVYMAAFACAD